MFVTKKTLEPAHSPARRRHGAGPAAARRHGSGLRGHDARGRRASPSSTPVTASCTSSGSRRRPDAASSCRRILAAARAVARRAERRHGPRASAGRHVRRRHGRSSALVGRLAHRRARLRPHARPASRSSSRRRPTSSRRRSSARTRSIASLELAIDPPTTRLAATPATASTSTPSRGATRRRRTSPRLHPRIVFERLFGDGGSNAERLARARSRGSILDSVSGEAARLAATLGRRRRREARRVSRLGARDRAAHPGRGVARRQRRRAAGASHRHPRHVRRARAS